MLWRVSQAMRGAVSKAMMAYRAQRGRGMLGCPLTTERRNEAMKSTGVGRGSRRV